MSSRQCVLAALAAASLAGCASLPGIPDSGRVEFVYQALNALDFAETINAARRPDCYWELDWPTAEVIGAHPSERSVAGAWAAYALGHYAVSAWLDREADETDSRAWHTARVAWHLVTIGNAAWHVAHNWRIGLRPFGAQCEVQP